MKKKKSTRRNFFYLLAIVVIIITILLTSIYLSKTTKEHNLNYTTADTTILQTTSLPTNALVRIEATPQSGGNVSPATGIYPDNAKITINAVPSKGYVFLSWNCEGSGCYKGQNQSANITVNGTLTEIANFQKEKVTLTASASPSNGGQVIGGDMYNIGAIASITAIPNPEYIFKDWTCIGNGCYSGPNMTAQIKLNSSITEIANFQIPTISISKDAYINITPGYYYGILSLSPNSENYIYGAGVKGPGFTASLTNVSWHQDVGVSGYSSIGVSNNSTGEVYTNDSGRNIAIAAVGADATPYPIYKETNGYVPSFGTGQIYGTLIVIVAGLYTLRYPSSYIQNNTFNLPPCYGPNYGCDSGSPYLEYPAPDLYYPAGSGCSVVQQEANLNVSLNTGIVTIFVCSPAEEGTYSVNASMLSNSSLAAYVLK